LRDYLRVEWVMLIMRVKKTALIICNDGKEYWITQKQFWNMVRERVVEQTGDQPLQGKFRGRDDQLLITLNHTVLNQATPIHTGEFLQNSRLKKSRR
jgi:hypothetical protein